MSIQTPPITQPDLARRLLRMLLADAAERSPLWDGLEVREVGPNAIATLQVRWRAHVRLAHPDECETAILQVLHGRDRVRSRDFEATLRDQFSAATVRRRLNRLVRLGVLRRFRTAPRGYELDDGKGGDR